jgi:DMSO/TMAO reductase YedYZ molybdopterin-dependent catalytic subunit
MHQSGLDSLDHPAPTRRRLAQLGAAWAAVWKALPLTAADPAFPPELLEAIAQLKYFTPVEEITTVLDKGKAGVTGFSLKQVREAGLAPESWTLEIDADPDGGSRIETPITLDWKGLMALADRHAVRFPHVCVCTNGADPFHMTLWEGVPLREIVWLTGPKGAIRRVRYESYHSPQAPAFQASLPLSQALETAPGQMPVILAYKMNGNLIPAAKGGPVRVIVPGAYGGKQIKWVRRIGLTNDYKSTDSDAGLNNDTESPLKTRARFIRVPGEVPAGKPAAVTGYAQVGVSGLAKVQYCVRSQREPALAGDPDLAKAEWKDAILLPPPSDWGGGLLRGKLPPGGIITDPKTGQLREWPLRYSIAHWAALIQPLAPGAYELACRTIDLNGIAQPMPRPFFRTGVNAIHRLPMVVKG